MLSRQTAELVVQLAEESLDTEAGFDVAAGLVTFGTDSATWRDLGLRAARLLERGDDATLGVQLIASIPDPEVQLHLAEVSRRVGEQVGLAAARALRGGTNDGGDPLAPFVVELLERASDPEDAEAFHALARLDLAQLGVQPSAFDAGRSAGDPATRFWAAIGAAKAGATQAALDLLDALPDEPPGFLWGDPWSAYDRIAEAAPVPTGLAAALAQRYSPDLHRVQRLLIGALTGRWDAEGEEVTASSTQPPSPAPPLDLDAFDLDVVADLLGEDVLLAQPVQIANEEIAALGPAEGGRLLSRLTERTMAATEDERLDLGNLTMRVASHFPSAHVPVRSLVSRYAQDPSTIPRIQLGAVLARGSDDELTSAVVETARAASAPVRVELAGLLRDTATCAASGATPLLGAGPGAAPTSPPVLSGPDRSIATDASPPTAAEPHRPRGTPARAPGSEDLPVEAHPLLEAPPAVIARAPFDVEMGLAEYARQTGTETAGSIPTRALATGSAKLSIEVELVVDPQSLVLHPDSSNPLTVQLDVTASTPFPSATVTLAAQTAPELQAERTLRLLFRVDGRVVGMAKRRLVVVDTEGQLATVPAPAPLTRRMLDLRPLLREQAPDLVIGVYRSDDRADTFVWDVYPLASTERLADADRRTRIPSDARDYPGYIRRAVAAKGATPAGTFRALAGYGDKVARTMPKALRNFLVALVAGRETAPSVLLLTEEAFVPWELAVFQDSPLHSTAGRDARFLGAHLAISRWPCDRDGPPPGPMVELSVDRRAVLTADYAGVLNAEELPQARAEALRFSQTYAPTTSLEPNREEVEAVLEGSVPVDLLHVALHGQFDSSAQEDGLVLLRPDGAGGHEREFLTALSIGGLLRNRVTTPFVFLNACQVGAGNDVLGTYAGLAVAVLRTGASGVVAPLWNIDDTVASVLAERFYTEALGEPPVAVAEILRQIRADYTLAAVKDHPETVTATYLAYQFFGHPRFELRLGQPTVPEEDPHG